MEVGVGVTAGCIATLRPLLQLAFTKFGIKGTTNKTPTRSKPAFGNVAGLPLDGLKPGQGIVTTITGHRDDEERGFWHSRSSSQEQLSPPTENIVKQVVVEYHGEEDRISSGRRFMKR